MFGELFHEVTTRYQIESLSIQKLARNLGVMRFMRVYLAFQKALEMKL